MSNYISGTYGLKYYAEWQNYREQVFRIEVQERGFAGTAKIMGDFQDAALEIQGDQGNVTAPIVKTQLRFSLVDSWDPPDTTTTKYGRWDYGAAYQVIGTLFYLGAGIGIMSTGFFTNPMLMYTVDIILMVIGFVLMMLSKDNFVGKKG